MNPKIVAVVVTAGTQKPKTATVTINMGDRHETAQGIGNGPFTAVVNAIRQIIPNDAKLIFFRIRAVGDSEEGNKDLTDGVAEVVVMLKFNGSKFRAVVRDEDSDVGFAKAYLGALNQWRGSATRK